MKVDVVAVELVAGLALALVLASALGPFNQSK